MPEERYESLGSSRRSRSVAVVATVETEMASVEGRATERRLLDLTDLESTE